MDESGQYPKWLWWMLGVGIAVALAAAALAILRLTRPAIPPGLVEMREATAQILDEQARIEDVDIRPLVDLEAKKDYGNATSLLDRALESNSKREALAASLVSVSGGLAKLAIQVKPDAIGTKAIAAFRILANLAETEKQFYADRRVLYEVTRRYYADLTAKKSPPIPENLRSLVQQVTLDMEKVNALHREFALAIAAFDEEFGGR